MTLNLYRFRRLRVQTKAAPIRRQFLQFGFQFGHFPLEPFPVLLRSRFLGLARPLRLARIFPLLRHTEPSKPTKPRAARLCRPECFRHILKAPCRPAPRGEALPVQFIRNLAGRAARCFQFPNAGKNRLLRRVRFQVHPVRRHAESEWDRPYPLAVRTLWCIASRVRSPMASRFH